MGSEKPGFGWTSRGLLLRARALQFLGLVMVAAVFVSGLAGHGWPGFGAVLPCMIASRLLMTPWLVTRLDRPGAPVRLALDLGSQALLVLILHGLGAGLAGLTGWQPALAGWLPGAAILVAGGLARAIWRPLPPEFDEFLSGAATQIETLSREIAQIAHAPAVEHPDLAALSQRLDNLPATGAPHQLLFEIVLVDHPGVPLNDLVLALFDRARASGTERDLRALCIAVTDPYVARQSLWHGDIEQAFELVVAAACHNALLCWEARATALLDLLPEAAAALPASDRLRDLAVQISGQTPYPDLPARLQELARRIETIARG